MNALNGTFQTVTNQVSSLGFDEPVLAALASAPLVSEGLYGAPPYNPTSTPSGGIWGDFWNAANAVATTFTGAIVSIVGEVWNEALAATTYLDQLGREALAVGGQLLTRTEGALVAVGGAIVGALELFLTEVLIPAIKALLEPILFLVQEGMQSFDSTVGAALQQAWAIENSTNSVSAAAANAIGTAYGGSPFETGLGIGVAVSIGLALLTPIDIGPSFLIGILVGLIAGAIESSGVVSGAVATLGASAVFAMENLVNASIRLPVSEWATIAGVVGLVAAGSEIPWSWYLISQAFKLPNGVGIASDAVVVMVVAMLAILIGITAVASHNPILILFAFVMAMISLAAVTVHFLISVASMGNPVLTDIGYVDVGLSIAGAAGSAADLGINIANL